MAVSVNNNQTYRLRDLRDSQVTRDRGEPRAPTRRPKFQDSMRDSKAGEVVGQFPPNFDKGPRRPTPRKNTLNEAATRMQPRQAVAALMARQGISTATRFGAKTRAAPETKFGAGAEERTEEKKAEAKSESKAWMSLLPEAKTEPVKTAEDKLYDQRLAKLEAAEKELKSLDRFSRSVDGYSSLEKHLKSNDQRVLTEAGKLDRTVMTGPQSKEALSIELTKKQMAMDQQLNLKYLELQDKLQRGLETLLSNLMKTRNEIVKNAISNV